MKKIIVLNGIHNSGKSSVGRYLNSHNFSYFPEIADELFKSGYSVGESGNGQLQLRLLELESLRDEEITDIENVIIESWHTAEIAHARLFDFDIAQKIEEAFAEKLQRFNPLFLYFDLPPELIPQRKSQLFETVSDDIIGFYFRLAEEYKNIFKKRCIY